ncbi:MAG: hypothetical protein ABEK84_01535 [Salinibacter sp.]
MGTCAATNKDGTPCSNDAMEGSEFCHVHRESTSTSIQAPPEEHGFGTMLTGALAVIVLTYVLLEFVLGV